MKSPTSTALLFTVLLTLLAGPGLAQGRFPKEQPSINGFRNPSIGLEYQRYNVSVHAGYYVTNFETNITTEFAKAGVTYWFLPVGKQEAPSSFYAQLSYLRGTSRAYKDQNAASLDLGFRWMAWKGLHLRIGVIALAAADKDLQINPTPGIGYAFTFWAYRSSVDAIEASTGLKLFSRIPAGVQNDLEGGVDSGPTA